VVRGPAGSGQAAMADVSWKKGSSNQLRSGCALALAAASAAAATARWRMAIKR